MMIIMQDETRRKVRKKTSQSGYRLVAFAEGIVNFKMALMKEFYTLIFKQEGMALLLNYNEIFPPTWQQAPLNISPWVELK